MDYKTDIVSFFGAKKPLFTVNELRGHDIARFVNREELLKFFLSLIRLKLNCAIIGEQGSGKSSFLLKLFDILKDDDHYVDYIQFVLPLQSIEKVNLGFLQEILRSILNIIKQHKSLKKLTEKAGVDVDFELSRLDFSIVIEKHFTNQNAINGELSLGAGKLLPLFLPADFKAKLDAKHMEEEKDIEKKDYYVHNEASIHQTIEKIMKIVDTPIILLIDELDKVGRYPLDAPAWETEVMKILELSRKLMENNNMVLVFSLQNELYQKLNDATKNKADVSILRLINSHKKLPLFDVSFAYAAVNQSLQCAEYKGTADDLFEKGLIELIIKLINGNPRLFMKYLLEALVIAFIKEQKQVTINCLKQYVFEIYDDMTEKQWQELIIWKQ